MRGQDDEIRAFYNACAHRGAPLVEERQGDRKGFFCRYHGWSYGLDGRLLAVREVRDFPDFDKTCHGLTPVRCESWGNWVFINENPDAAQVAEITLMAADAVRIFGIEPRVAMLSYSNFGSSDTPGAAKVARATALIKEMAPDLEVEGEMQANMAFNTELREELFPFSTLRGEPNILIFPDLNAANIAYKLFMRLAEVDTIRRLQAQRQQTTTRDIAHGGQAT